MSSAADVVRNGARGGGRSVAWPIFALVLVSVIVAAGAIFAVTFNGPPPRLPLGDPAGVVAVLKTGVVPEGMAGPPLHFERRDAPPPVPRAQFRADRTAAATLAAALGVPVRNVVAYTMRPPEDEGGSAFGRDFILGWHTPDGWRVVATPRPFLAPWHLQTLFAMLIAVVGLAILGAALARAISRPIAQVARAAERARAGASLPPLPQGGSREVRALSQAVAAMHARLTAHAQGRTTMLAAIAHDLGTPLSRIAFWIEQLPEEARTRAAADIDEMRAMLGAALAFARDDTGDHAVTRVDLGSLLDSLAEDMAAAGAPVTLEPGPRAIVRGDSAALRRLFANLAENAVRYGDRATIGWNSDGTAVAVTIDDNGPGVDAATVERLFEPFVRGDPSRNRSTGGTGLGLAIVRSIATRHGGTAVLENRTGGGARARVTLPLSIG